MAMAMAMNSPPPCAHQYTSDSQWSQSSIGPATQVNINRTSGVFYAYIQFMAPGDTNLFIAVFSNRQMADEWWRATRADESLASIQRASSQLYLCSEGQSGDFLKRFAEINVPPIHGTFIGPISTTALTMLNPDPFRDLISGESFLIRSAADPRVFWHVCGSDVNITQTNPTPFRIRAVDYEEEKGNPGTVMVGSDRILIDDIVQERGVEWNRVGSRLYLNTAPQGQQGQVFNLSDLLYNPRFAVNDCGQVYMLPEGQKGQLWELV